jgi:hypothetical protein
MISNQSKDIGDVTRLGGVLVPMMELKRLVLSYRYLTPINRSRDLVTKPIRTRDSTQRYAPSSLFGQNQ